MYKIGTHTQQLNSAWAGGPLELNYAKFGLKQIDRLLVEVGRELWLYRRYLGEGRGEGAKRHSKLGVLLIETKT